MRDVEFSGDQIISSDVSIDLNGMTLRANGVLNIKGSAEMILKNGNYELNNETGSIQVRPTEVDGCTLIAENVNFINNFLKRSNPSWSFTNNRTQNMLITCPETSGDIPVMLRITKCTFKNAIITFGGLSRDIPCVSNLDAVFDNCKFEALTGSKIIEVNAHVTGDLKFDNCNFNLTCTYSTSCIDIVNWDSTSLNFVALNNKFHAEAAQKYTHDKSNGEDARYDVYVPYNVSNIKFINYSYNANSSTTVVETGTTYSGIASTVNASTPIN